MRLPVTGASDIRKPRSITALYNSRIQSGLRVLHSIAMLPEDMAARAPFSPSHAVCEAASSASIAITNAASLAAWAGLSATVAPEDSNASALDDVRLQTVAGEPAFNRLAAI